VKLNKRFTMNFHERESCRGDPCGRPYCRRTLCKPGDHKGRPYGSNPFRLAEAID